MDFLVLNYTSDISGSTVALLRLLDEPRCSEKFCLVSAPMSYASRVAEEKKWPHHPFKTPLLKRSLSPMYWAGYLYRSFQLGKELARLCKKNQHKYVLINCSVNIGWLPFFKFFSKGNAIKRPKILWIIHELELQPKWFFSWILKKIERHADLIFGVSHAVQEKFTSQINLLPNCLSDITKWPDLSDAAHSNPFTNTLKLLWVGTVTPRKGLHLLPELISQFLKLNLPLELEIVASVTPNQKKYFADCLKILSVHPVKLEVKFNTDPTEVPYQPKKVLVHQALQPESFNMVALEAMGQGMLVFCNSGGGVQDFGIHMENLIFLDQLQKPIADLLMELKTNPSQTHSIQSSALKTAQTYSSKNTGDYFWRGVKSIS